MFKITVILTYFHTDCSTFVKNKQKVGKKLKKKSFMNVYYNCGDLSLW